MQTKDAEAPGQVTTRDRHQGMLYRRPGSRFRWIKYYRNGRPVRESTGTENQKDVEDKLKGKLGDIATGRPGCGSMSWPRTS